MTNQVRITYYGGDGHGSLPDDQQPRIVGEYPSEEAARDAILDYLGDDYGSWQDPDTDTNCYHESGDEGCGGFCIVED